MVQFDSPILTVCCGMALIFAEHVVLCVCVDLIVLECRVHSLNVCSKFIFAVVGIFDAGLPYTQKKGKNCSHRH